MEKPKASSLLRYESIVSEIRLLSRLTKYVWTNMFCSGRHSGTTNSWTKRSVSHQFSTVIYSYMLQWHY